MPAAQLLSIEISRRSTAEQVADALRERILRRELRPGTPLREVAVAGSVGVSRNTVREAFLILAGEGLVTHNPHHGVVVTRLTERDIEEIYRVRRVIELAAVDEIESLSEASLHAMSVTLAAMDKANAAKDWWRVVEEDLRFHSEIARLLPSRRLIDFHAQALAEMRLSASLFDRLHQEQNTVREHRAIYDFLKRGDRRGCRKLLESHLLSSARMLSRMVGEESAE